MKILSINKELKYGNLNIDSISLSSLSEVVVQEYDYIIINGGDGAIRRTIQQLQHIKDLPIFILNPIGSFNVIAKLNRVAKLEKVLQNLEDGNSLKLKQQKFYKLNSEIFLFSAGNMGDLQHIFISETLRFGFLKQGILKYILTLIFLLPIHILVTPFMLLSSRRFFIFTPFSFIEKFGTFYGKIDNIKIDLANDYNFIELDGDIVTIYEDKLNISNAGTINIGVL
jgi:hypothetical protein